MKYVKREEYQLFELGGIGSGGRASPCSLYITLYIIETHKPHLFKETHERDACSPREPHDIFRLLGLITRVK